MTVMLRIKTVISLSIKKTFYKTYKVYDLLGEYGLLYFNVHLTLMTRTPVNLFGLHWRPWMAVRIQLYYQMMPQPLPSKFL